MSRNIVQKPQSLLALIGLAALGSWFVATPTAHATPVDSIRVTEYYITSFTAQVYNLTLNQNLADDYFVIIRGSSGADSSSGDRSPDMEYAALYRDPNGTGDLGASSGSDVIQIARGINTNTWVGVVTVVECLADCDVSGFQLLDIQRPAHTGISTSGTDTSGTAWNDINQVMLMAGVNGAGCGSYATLTSQFSSCWLRFWPSSTTTINWARDGTTTLQAAQSTVMVIEWGSEWTVQRVNVTGTNGGDGADATGEYNTGSISSVVRANTWVWGTGNSASNTVGQGAESILVTLGNGVAQNSSETTVAVGSEYTASRNFDVYVLTHPDLAVDYRFKTDGNSTDLTVGVTVDSATTDRAAIVYNGMNGTDTAFPRPLFSARYTANTTVTLKRRRSGESFPAWVQGIDFSGITDATYDQSAYRFFQNDDSTDVGGALAAQDTAATLDFNGDAFRLRMLLHVDDAEVPLNDKTFKLQFAEKSGTCDTGFSGESYSDVTGGTAVAYSNNSTPADGDNLTDNVNDPVHSGHTTQNQDYEEANNFTNSVAAIGEDEDGMWDFSLVDNSGTAGKTYCLRAVESDGTLLETYDVIPEVTFPAGELSVDIVDAAGDSVSSPSVGFSAITVGFSEQESTGTLGISTEKIRVTNTMESPAWTLSIAAADGITDLWYEIGGESYDFNGSASEGRLTVDPSGGSITAIAPATSTTGIFLGSSNAFQQGVVDSITLMSAGITAENRGIWDLTGVDLTQDVPAEQPASDYDIDFTLTVS